MAFRLAAGVLVVLPAVDAVEIATVLQESGGKVAGVGAETGR